MAELKLTEQQHAAVFDRGGSLLVSAAAGSGKTKVLVERVFSYLTQERCDVDDFLIITYTRAAAAELRARLAAELAARVAATPEDRHLRRQMFRVYQADIKTVDAFCAALLREHIHLLEPVDGRSLTPDFRVLDEAEARLLKDRALERTLEAFYQDIEGGDREFELLAGTLGAGRDDRALAELVLELHEKIQSHPYPAQWLHQAAEGWRQLPDRLVDSVYGRTVMEDTVRKALFWAKQLERAVEAMGDCETVTWPVTDGAGGQLLPSFAVGRIARIFPQVTVEREDGGYRRELPSAALALAGQEPGGPLWRYFAEHGEAPLLARMEQTRAMGRGRLSPQAVETLYGRRIAMSASRIDRLKSCHFGYFMEYGLRAKERTSAGFEAPEVGTFIHYLLENVNRDICDRGGYGRVDRAALRRLVHHYVDEYARTQIDGYAGKSARFRYLFSRLRETACAIVENIADEMAVSDFRPVAFELGFGGKDGQLPAVTVTEGNTTLSVGGKVDRVDGWIKNGRLYLRVVDYKTGKKTFDLTDVRYGLGIQMLLYLFTLQKEGGAYFGRPVEPAGVLYMPARDIILRADRAVPPDKLEDMLRRELRRTGMLLGEPEVLTAMEHSALDAPCYLPVGTTKDGAVQGLLSSVVVNAAQMGKMARYIDSLLHRVAREIGDGNIDADPCTRGPQDSACAWCAFQAACWFDESRDKPHYLRKTTPEEFWQVVDREVEQHG